jgi:hypothetical protein
MTAAGIAPVNVKRWKTFASGLTRFRGWYGRLERMAPLNSSISAAISLFNYNRLIHVVGGCTRIGGSSDQPTLANKGDLR